ncbi:hypothetical protein ES703_10405 [subsurface metagenome]
MGKPRISYKRNQGNARLSKSENAYGDVKGHPCMNRNKLSLA